MIWTGESVAAVLNTDSDSDRSFSEVSTDTRTLKRKALFVALTGEHFDGHDFLEAAREAGATGAVVRRGSPHLDGMEQFEVDDPLVALGLLARARRREVPGPVIAVTGTNGKTATKEMLAKALGTRWKVHSTLANLNNLIGVPQAILTAPDGTEALVLEAGANAVGEIERLRGIIEPTVAVVTNVSASHLAGFGSLEAVLAEKVSLVRDAPVAVVGTRPEELFEEAGRSAHRVISAGTGGRAEVTPDEWTVGEDGRGTLTFRGQRVELPLVGRHQVENATIALAVAVELDLDLTRVARALEEVSLPAGRCEVVRWGGDGGGGGGVILNDSYNANPESMRASLETAADMRADRPFVAVVGSMLELGEHSSRLHLESAEAILRQNPKLIGATGDFIDAFETLGVPGDRLVTSRDVEELGSVLRGRLTGNEFVLVKASRGVGLERVIPLLTGGN
ncbi:MAG: UDP-N-acetylmuramoyl-tripeptide--D-alanyl-D-alanine ligase [Gemmatimonadetes bacterium]|nr:UDP-N-acetylmuramoyl-tripeptide--D-alanyl-D-alanine ligase [Gemmatimonadota bacterium]